MATQKGRNWSSGDIVTAANLSSIERGVSAVAEEYTPTTWANGNTVTAAALNNIEQGIANAGGGGGSSPLTSAKITFINTIPPSAHATSETFYPTFHGLDGHAIIDYCTGFYMDEDIGIVVSADDGFGVDENHTEEYQCYVLPNYNFFVTYPNGDIDDLTLSGNVTKTYFTGGENFPCLLITGDCTITISSDLSNNPIK